jgi:hypothetical protein
VIGTYKPVTLVGCPGNSVGVLLNPGDGGRPAMIGLSAAGGARVKVVGLSIDTTHAHQDGMDVFGGATMDLSDVVFGNAGGSLDRIQIGVAWGGTLVVNGDVTTAGSASSFLELGSDGTAYWNNNGNPASPMHFHVVGRRNIAMAC